MTPALVLLLAYSAGLVALGLWIGRRVGTTGAFFVAGRNLGPGLLFATLLAANIGAGSTVGAAGLGYRDGISAWWWVGSAGIGTIILALWVGPRMWRIAKERDLLTVGDFLELRYGPSVRAIVAALLWLATLAILAGQLIAAAWVLEVVAGLPKWAGCLAGGVVMTAYFAAGGLLTSAWVNLVQLSVLLVGFAIALPVAMIGAGGWDAVLAAAPPDRPDWLGFMHGGASGWTYLFLLVPAFIISPGLIQKAYGARDEATVRRAGVACGLVLLAFAFVPPLLGMTARAISPGLVNPELALPTVLLDGLPVALGALALAAVFSAEISSADAILFMLATSLSEDLWRRFFRPEATDAEVLRTARICRRCRGRNGDRSSPRAPIGDRCPGGVLHAVVRQPVRAAGRRTVFETARFGRGDRGDRGGSGGGRGREGGGDRGVGSDEPLRTRARGVGRGVRDRLPGAQAIAHSFRPASRTSVSAGLAEIRPTLIPLIFR